MYLRVLLRGFAYVSASFPSPFSSASVSSQAQMDALRDTAREMGATTKFSASEAADAMGYMDANV